MRNCWSQASKMIQWLRILAANSGKPSLILRPLIMEDSPAGCPLTATCVPRSALARARTHTHTDVIKKFNKITSNIIFFFILYSVYYLNFLVSYES